MISMIELAGVLSSALLCAAGCAHLLQRVAPEPQSTATRPAHWGTTDGSFHYVRRPRRYQVTCPVCYGTHDVAGTGLVIDMSRNGWRIQGRTSVPVGGRLALTVTLPGEQDPLTISEAAVEWTGQSEFGIRLVSVSPDAAERLSDFFRVLEAPLTAGMEER